MAAILNPRTSLMANAIRALAMDAVQQANSGHPGAPMGMAEIAVALWRRHLRHNPSNPHWPDRDRFVLSNGHGSMLAYALLHLTGYDLPMSELRNFRQLHSKTPGHPEVGITPGIETTTGPLGQGITNAVGMALAEKLLAKEFNRDGNGIVDHHTYVFLGDGCLMEGISHEACALAGAWRLNKLIALYDDNGISIDGQVAPWFVDDTPARFEAYGWNVIRAVDGHDVDAVDAAIGAARKADKPTLICCKTTIGKGSPNRAGTAKAHGEALGPDEIKLTRAALNWPHEPFVIPEDAYSAWDCKASGHQLESEWDAKFAIYKAAFPELAAEFTRRMRGDLPAGWAQAAVDAAVAAHTKAETVASRKASQLALEAFTKALPELLGGSADLTGSNLTNTTSTAAAAHERRRQRQRRPPHQLRRARVRHGGHHERRGAARRLHPVRRHLPDVQRLQPQRDPHGRADEAARGACVHARQHRPRRRRADAPEHRTRGQPAADSGPRRLAPGRHRRDHGRLGLRDPEPPAPERAAALAPEPRLCAEGLARRDRARRLRAGRTQRGGSEEGGAGGHHRHRLRGAIGTSCAGATRTGRHRGARRLDALHQRVRPPERRPTRRRCCPRSCRASPSRWA